MIVKLRGFHCKLLGTVEEMGSATDSQDVWRSLWGPSWWTAPRPLSHVPSTVGGQEQMSRPFLEGALSQSSDFWCPCQCNYYQPHLWEQFLPPADVSWRTVGHHTVLVWSWWECGQPPRHCELGWHWEGNHPSCNSPSHDINTSTTFHGWCGVLSYWIGEGNSKEMDPWALLQSLVKWVVSCWWNSCTSWRMTTLVWWELFWSKESILIEYSGKPSVWSQNPDPILTAMVCQIISLPNLWIINFSFGHTGSTHDATVWTHTCLAN